MVLHSQCAPGSCLVKDATKVDKLRRKGDRADRENAKQAELDGKYLICSRDFDWDAHGEFLVLILGRLLVLLDKEATACLQNTAVRFQFRPDLKRSVTLDEAKCWIKLEVLLEVLRKRQLDFHSICASIVKNDFFSVELLIDKHIQVILFLLDVNGHINARTSDCNRDRLRVVLVLEEECESLRHLSQLHRYESELDFRATVTVNLCCALEADLGEELVEDISLGRDID